MHHGSTSSLVKYFPLLFAKGFIQLFCMGVCRVNSRGMSCGMGEERRPIGMGHVLLGNPEVKSTQE